MKCYMQCATSNAIPLIHQQLIWHVMYWSMLGHNDAHVLVELSGFSACDIEAL